MHAKEKFKYAVVAEDDDAARTKIVLCETATEARSVKRTLAKTWDETWLFRIVGWSPAPPDIGEDALTFRHAGKLYEAQIEAL